MPVERSIRALELSDVRPAAVEREQGDKRETQEEEEEEEEEVGVT